MSLVSFVEDILFVIVLYKTRPEESAAYTSLLNVAEESSVMPAIFLYDNSPQACSVERQSVFYRHDPRNSGVAKAYNESFLVACDKQKKWILLLDQDTTLHSDFLKDLSESTANHPTSAVFVPRLRDRHGTVSPLRWSLGRGKRLTSIPPTLSLRKFRFLNSGLLISTASFKKTGGYPENIPLYFSDIAFGEKLMKETDHFVVLKTELLHGFSATEHIPLEEALHRYSFFCEGALAMGRTFGPFWLYYVNGLSRGLNLSVRYKTMDFVKIFFSR